MSATVHQCSAYLHSVDQCDIRLIIDDPFNKFEYQYKLYIFNNIERKINNSFQLFYSQKGILYYILLLLFFISIIINNKTKTTVSTWVKYKYLSEKSKLPLLVVTCNMKRKRFGIHETGHRFKVQ